MTMKCAYRTIACPKCPNPPTHWYDATRGTVPFCEMHANEFLNDPLDGTWAEKYVRPMNGQEDMSHAEVS